MRINRNEIEEYNLKCVRLYTKRKSRTERVSKFDRRTKNWYTPCFLMTYEYLRVVTQAQTLKVL